MITQSRQQKQERPGISTSMLQNAGGVRCIEDPLRRGAGGTKCWTRASNNHLRPNAKTRRLRMGANIFAVAEFTLLTTEVRLGRRAEYKAHILAFLSLFPALPGYQPVSGIGENPRTANSLVGCGAVVFHILELPTRSSAPPYDR